MPAEFFKLDVHFFEHPKVDGLPATALCLFLASVAYANRLETDGYVPAATARRLMASWPEPGPAGDEVLVDAGLWERVDGGYRIHGFLEHNQSRADREKLRAGWRERQQRHREPPGSVTRRSRRDTPESHGRVTAGSPTLEGEGEREKEQSPSDRSAIVANQPVNAQQIVGAYIDRYGRPSKPIVGQLARQLKQALEDGIDLEHVLGGLEDWHARDQHPSTLASFIDVRRRGGQPRAAGRVARGRQQLIDTHRALQAWAAQKEAQRGRAGVDPDRGPAQRELPRPGAPPGDGRGVVRRPGQLPGQGGTGGRRTGSPGA